MATTDNAQQARILKPDELAVCIRLLREIRQWSQEQLAAISGLNVRTIQRVEQGLAASLDTRRALANAFGFEDIDALNKPYTFQSEEELKAAKEKFDREHVTLKALPVMTGKQLAVLAETSMMDLSEPAFDLPRETEEVFASMTDYFREYRDCADLYSASQKLDVYDEMQAFIDTLKSQGVSLRYAQRKMQMRSNPDLPPTPFTSIYIIGFPVGNEPEQFAVPKAINFSI